MRSSRSAPTALITGGSGGIGLHTALRLAADGYEVTIVGRNAARGQAARDRIAQASVTKSATFIAADLSTLAAVRELAERYPTETPPDALINNVGGMNRTRQFTADGVEATFAMSHLHSYYLTELMLPRMTANGGGRIVNLGSNASAFADHTPFTQADMDGRYFGMPAYGRAKLAHMAYSVDLARRLEGSTVDVAIADPGATATEMGRSMRADFFPFPSRLAWPLIWLNLRRTDVAVSAEATHHAVNNEDRRTGIIYHPRNKTTLASPAITNLATAEAVVTLSAELTSGH